MEQLLTRVVNYVTSIYREKASPAFVYHNYSHTLEVVLRTQEIAGYYTLTEDELLAVLIAAWFHDIGYLFTNPANHEEFGVAIMRVFLEQHFGRKKLIERVTECIMATKFPQKPIRLIEKILCDADTYHVGTNNFFIVDDRIREELILREGQLVEDWDRYTLSFLQNHHFFTSYCQERLNPTKLLNVSILKSRMG